MTAVCHFVDDIAASELEHWNALPERQQRYVDEPCGEPEAEEAYRVAFAGAVSEVLHHHRQLFDDNTPDEFFDEPNCAEMLADAKEARSEHRRTSVIGEHVFHWPVGHEIEAARHRGQHHGLSTACERCCWLDLNEDDVEFALSSWLESLAEWSTGPFGSSPPPGSPLEPQSWPVRASEDIARKIEGIEASLTRCERCHNYSTDSVCEDCRARIEFNRKNPCCRECFTSLDAMGLCDWCEKARTRLPSPPPGFLSQFVEHCVQTAKRPQRELALANGLALLGTLVGRKLRDRLDTRPNVFLVALAGTGSGKEHSRAVSKKLLVEIRREQAFAESFASAQSIVTRVHDVRDVLGLIDEFGRYLSTSTRRGADAFLSQIPTAMMKLYSSSNSIFVGDCYANSKLMPSKVIPSPNLNVYATTIPNNFFAALGSENSVDGLLNRFLIFETPDDLPSLQANEPKPLPEVMVLHAKFWAELVVGHGDLADQCPEPLLVPETEDATRRLDEFSKDADFKARQATSQSGRGLWCRAYEQVRKLALLYAASESREPIISLAAANWAIAFVLRCTEFVERAAADWISDSPWQAQCKTVLRLIAEAGSGGIAHGKLVKALDHRFKSREVGEILSNLRESGQIEVREERTGGRPRTVLVATRHD